MPSILDEWGHLMCRVEFDLHIAHERAIAFLYTRNCAGTDVLA